MASKMPGRKRTELNQDLCFRCQEEQYVVKIRSDWMCKNCFDKYVGSKVFKRLDSFRVRHHDSQQTRTILLALSCGPCSVALLHLLENELQRQMVRSGRVGFQLHVLHVQDTPPYGERTAKTWDEIMQRYPDHTYSEISFNDLKLPSELVDSIHQQNPTYATANEIPKLIDKLRSASTRADVAQMLFRKAIIRFAHDQHCDAVLWGDSTTTLAARVLAETAKGRGINLPMVSADGESASGIPQHYPMRDLLSKEIREYLAVQDPSFQHVLESSDVKPSVSTKNSTIDDLTKQYFDSVDRDYPSIVSNVVKTTEKLRKDELTTTEERCELCSTPLSGNAPPNSRLCHACLHALSVDS